MKHLFKLTLLLLALLSTAKPALAYDFEVDGIYYNINGTNASVAAPPTNIYYSGYMTIPSAVSYSGTTYAVTKIDRPAFAGCSNLTGVTIPNSVTEIGAYAFSSCSGLTSITIPSSVIKIGNLAFKGCTALHTLNFNAELCNDFSSDVSSIEPYQVAPFYNLNISTINIGASVKRLPAYFASSLTKLTSITFPNTLNEIGNLAFIYCTGLSSVTIPSSINFIGAEPFAACTGLTSMSVASDNPDYDSRNNCNGIIETATNNLIAGCINTVIPNTVTKMDGAFAGYETLTNIDIPNSITYIGWQAFFGCTNLTSVNIPSSVISIGNEAFALSGLTSIEIPNSVTYIDMGAFQECTNLTNVTIGKGVNTISLNVFYDCTSLRTMTCLAPTPPSTNYYTFYNIYGNVTLYVPDESLTAYQTANNWKNFYSILPISEQPTAEMGDVDGDGKVDISDVTTLIDLLLNGGEMTAGADVDGDGKVDITDVTTLIDKLLNGN